MQEDHADALAPQVQGATLHSRRVDDESIPLALDVVVGRLLGDVEAVELQFPGDLLLPLEHHQRHLVAAEHRQDAGRALCQSRTPAASYGATATHLQTVVADHAEQRDEGVEDGQEAQCGQHVAGALLQDKLVHVEERVLIVLLVAAPAVLAVLVLVLLGRDLEWHRDVNRERSTLNANESAKP